MSIYLIGFLRLMKVIGNVLAALATQLLVLVWVKEWVAAPEQ